MRFSSEPRTTTFVFCVALYFLLVMNLPFWRQLLTAIVGIDGGGALFAVAVFVVLLLAMNTLLSFFAIRFVLKPFVIILLLTGSLAFYFMNAYGVMLDRTMLQNLIETDPGEASELLNPELLACFLVLGAAPAFLVMRARIRFHAPLRELATRVGVVLVGLAGVGVLLLAFNKDFAFAGREYRYLRYVLNPTGYLYSATTLLARSFRDAPGAISAVGEDVRRGLGGPPSARRAVVVLVIGETARAANFSLGGYDRLTNPRLAEEGVLYFENVHSCGTSTASSLPCMFSHLGRRRSSKAKRFENVLDVVSRAGLHVLWRDNNSGCKGICARVEMEQMRRIDVGDLCATGECFDESLLVGLDEKIDQSEGDVLIVLHQKGSHGPAYHRRYPPHFEHFQPVCVEDRLQACSRDEIVNAYDNTILYTDHLLSEVIAFLEKRSERIDGAMLYVSDHGESLGEDNLYLHGLPYALAPDVQTRVPLILWLSPAYERRFAIDHECLAARRSEAVTHDHLFHSLLGMLRLETRDRIDSLDLFARCRVPAAS